MTAASAVRTTEPVGEPVTEPVTEAANELATVIANLGDNMFLTQAGGQGRACRRAASCLLLPEPGDKVLLAGAGGAWFLLAVIERAAATPAQLHVDGDLVVSGATLQLRSQSLIVEAQEGQVSVDTMRFAGTLWQGAVGTARLVAQACESIAGRFVQHAKTSFRTVEQVERVRTGQLDLQATDLVRIHSRCVMAKATDVYKVDAKLMHMG